MRKVKYVDSLELVRKTVGPISKNLIYSRTVGQTKGEVQVRPLVATTSGCRPDQRTRDQSRVRTAHLHNPIANSITLFNGEHLRCHTPNRFVNLARLQPTKL